MVFFHEPMTIFEVIYSAVIIVGIVMFSGFCLTLALFPKNDEIDILDRLGLSVILGFTPYVVLYFLDKNFNVPINFLTSVLCFMIIIVAGLAVWRYRIMKQKI